MCPTDISSRLTPIDAATKANASFSEEVGALMLVMTMTRPDFAFAVDNVSRLMDNSQDKH